MGFTKVKKRNCIKYYPNKIHVEVGITDIQPLLDSLKVSETLPSEIMLIECEDLRVESHQNQELIKYAISIYDMTFEEWVQRYGNNNTNIGSINFSKNFFETSEHFKRVIKTILPNMYRKTEIHIFHKKISERMSYMFEIANKLLPKSMKILKNITPSMFLNIMRSSIYMFEMEQTDTEVLIRLWR